MCRLISGSAAMAAEVRGSCGAIMARTRRRRSTTSSSADKITRTGRSCDRIRASILSLSRKRTLTVRRRARPQGPDRSHPAPARWSMRVGVDRDRAANGGKIVHGIALTTNGWMARGCRARSRPRLTSRSAAPDRARSHRGRACRDITACGGRACPPMLCFTPAAQTVSPRARALASRDVGLAPHRRRRCELVS